MRRFFGALFDYLMEPSPILPLFEHQEPQSFFWHWNNQPRPRYPEATVIQPVPMTEDETEICDLYRKTPYQPEPRYIPPPTPPPPPEPRPLPPPPPTRREILQDIEQEYMEDLDMIELFQDPMEKHAALVQAQNKRRR